MASSSSRPTSVRGLYTPPSEEWVFLPPTINPPSSGASSSSSSSPSAHLPTPFTPTDDDDLPRFANGLYGPLQLFAAEYFTTALGMPFEVGRTLLQIEYRPRGRLMPVEEEVSGEKVQRDWGAEDDELSNPEEAEVYFTDRLAAPSSTFVPPPVPSTLAPPDPTGYLPDLHPSWMLKDEPDISRGNGVWGMFRRLRSTPSEGLPSLWKGQLITTFHSLLSKLLQPSILTSLLLLAPSPVPLDMPLTALPSPLIPLGIQVASHLLTHLLLSPLELMRTRLIAMPASHPSTPGTSSLFRSVISEEGGLATLYFHPNILIPAILEHTIRPLLTLSIPLLLERQLGIAPELSPVLYSVCDLSLGVASLLVLLPIETVRRRLQVQRRGSGTGKKINSVVKLRDREYVGVVETIYRIVTEETGVGRKRDMTEKDEGGVFSGVRQLYRGFGMAVTAHFAVFGLGLVSASLGGTGFDSGWKEI